MYSPDVFLEIKFVAKSFVTKVTFVFFSPLDFFKFPLVIGGIGQKKLNNFFNSSEHTVHFLFQVRSDISNHVFNESFKR